MKSDGYLLVASCHYRYYMSALFCAETIRDYYPNANITLATHEQWVDNRCDIFNNVITKDFPISIRSKLWALSKTPYKNTLYIDADCEIMHPDICNVFNQVKDRDLVFSKIRKYNAAIVHLRNDEKLKYHGGVFLYNDHPNTLEFLDLWWEQWKFQRQKKWPFDPISYDRKLLKNFDMFALFWLLEKKEWKDKLNIGYFQDDARWNFHNGYRSTETKNPIVIYHHTLRDMTENDNDINPKQGNID